MSNELSKKPANKPSTFKKIDEIVVEAEAQGKSPIALTDQQKKDILTNQSQKAGVDLNPDQVKGILKLAIAERHQSEREFKEFAKTAIAHYLKAVNKRSAIALQEVTEFLVQEINKNNREYSEKVEETFRQTEKQVRAGGERTRQALANIQASVEDGSYFNF